MTDDITEAEFRDGLASRLHDVFGRVEGDIRCEPSGKVCDLLVESPSGTRFAIEVADALEWQDPTQALFYADTLDARPVVAFPAGSADLDVLLPLATRSPATLLPISYP